MWLKVMIDKLERLILKVHPLLELFAKGFDILLLHGLYRMNGLSRRTVLIRSIWSWLVCTFILGSILCHAGITWRFSEEFAMVFIACFAMFWGFYQNFHGEFVSKYLRLAEIHDNKLTSTQGCRDTPLSKSKELSDEDKGNLNCVALNFAEDCKKYHMEKEDSFSPTFNRIINSIEISLRSGETKSKRKYLEDNLPELFTAIDSRQSNKEQNDTDKIGD